MAWKDFLYFRRGSQTAVILLLILIVLTLILNILLSYRNSSPIVVMQNDSIVREFDEFLKNLQSSDSSASTRQKEPRHSYHRSREDGPATAPYVPPKYGSGSHENMGYDNVNSDQRHSSDFTRYPRVEKLSTGETISLNTTDTSDWKKIPGIGTVYASRIVEYRERLGGFVHKEQLMEVYGVDSEMFARVSPYIESNGNWTKLPVNNLEFKELLRHPYLNYKQVQAIVNLRQRKGDITSIGELAMLDEFTPEDIYRLEPYLEF